VLRSYESRGPRDGALFWEDPAYEPRRATGRWLGSRHRVWFFGRHVTFASLTIVAASHKVARTSTLNSHASNTAADQMTMKRPQPHGHLFQEPKSFEPGHSGPVGAVLAINV
jgi:hypothetical protein